MYNLFFYFTIYFFLLPRSSFLDSSFLVSSFLAPPSSTLLPFLGEVGRGLLIFLNQYNRLQGEVEEYDFAVGILSDVAQCLLE